jgi:hypothetical protein
MPTTISPPRSLKCIQKEKTIQLGQKLKCVDSPKEVCAQCPVGTGQHNPQHAQCAKCVTVYTKICALI